MTPKAAFRWPIAAGLAMVFAGCLCGVSAIGQTPTLPPTPAETTSKSAAGKAEAERRQDPVREAWEKLRSWSLADLLNWIRIHALRVLIILLLAFGILSLANRLHGRLVKIVADFADRGSSMEKENRARTLVGVLHNALRTVVIALAAIMLLQEIGVPVGTLLGGVAVAGLAVAFGAQSLIKDYFTGFLILLEQQYMIGDVVKIGAITGQVEQITLRVTVLRDAEGSVHFIPHGQVNVVSNLTYGWSQAVFDLNVAASEDVDRVRELFFELATELRGDATYGKMILDDPQMLGIDSLGDATFILKFALKTLPQKRWQVKRELLRRIKDKFQALKIKVSVPP